MAKKIIQRIDGVLKQINHVQEELGSVSFEDFLKQKYVPEAVSFSVSQVGERMNKLEELLGNIYPDLPWKAARRMRNIIVHDYDNVRFDEVYSTATKDLPVLKQKLLDIKAELLQTKLHTLETERLYLRPWDDFDADELFELAKEPEIGLWCGWEPHKHIRDTFFALHNFLEFQDTYCICLKNNEIIGSIGLHLKEQTELTDKDNECELGFWIGKQFWGNGYATEAAQEIIRHAFNDLNIQTIWCSHYEGNNRSKRVQEKLGFKYSKMQGNIVIGSTEKPKITVIYKLTKQDWAAINH